jgi:hypothetical protein
MPRQTADCVAISTEAIMAPDEGRLESNALADNNLGGYLRAIIWGRNRESRVSRGSFLLGVMAGPGARGPAFGIRLA